MPAHTSWWPSSGNRGHREHRSLERDWPLFGLRITTPRTTLSYPTEIDLGALNDLANQGIHDRDVMPFDTPWTDEAPEIRPQHSLQFYWATRANWKPSNWHLTMMVTEGDTIVGIQG